MSMIFPYERYFSAAFAVPLAGTIFISVVLILSVGSMIKKILRKDQIFVQVYGIVMVSCLCAFFLWKDISTLASGGIYLSFERETDAVSLTGKIERIELLDEYKYPKLRVYGDPYEEVCGVCLTIDGNSYMAISAGKLEAGDRVEMVYLPKSSYVLEIHKR